MELILSQGPSPFPPHVDLNADLGEEVTDDEGLLGVVTSANVACGYHAGSPEIMRRVCEGAAGSRVSIGAQVSYDDRAHFGRRDLDVDPGLLAEQVEDQVGTLTEIASAAGVAVRYVKPHGALYHRVLGDPDQARAVLAGSGRLPVLSQAGGVILGLAGEAGRGALREGFPDRGYGAGGRLLPRDRPGAVLQDGPAITEQALRLAPSVDSLCVHGDHPGALEHARAVRVALEGAGWVLRGL